MSRTIALLLAACALGGRQDAAKPRIDQLVLTRGVGPEPEAPMREAVERLSERVRDLAVGKGEEKGAVRQELRSLGGSEPDAASRARTPLGLAVYRAMREAEAASAFALEWQPTLGVLRALGFDGRRGVEASFSQKFETDKAVADEDEDEAKEQVERVVSSMVEAFRAQQEAADAPPGTDVDANDRTAGEDPPEFGFRWSYVREGGEQYAHVTAVFPESASARAGLRPGDVVVQVNGAAVNSPPRFGRAVGGLRAGAPLVLEVRRGSDERATIKGVVQRASEVVPAYEQGLVGAALPGFRADLGAAPVQVGGKGEAGEGPRPAATIVCVFDPRRVDTLDDAAVLAWIRDHFAPDRVAIAGIGTGVDEATLRAFMDEWKLGWPAAADADGALVKATRTVTLPALLLADRDGIVRFRHLHGGRLQHALRALLVAQH